LILYAVEGWIEQVCRCNAIAVVDGLETEADRIRYPVHRIDSTLKGILRIGDKSPTVFGNIPFTLVDFPFGNIGNVILHRVSVTVYIEFCGSYGIMGVGIIANYVWMRRVIDVPDM
jgi:hypothetical protein